MPRSAFCFSLTLSCLLSYFTPCSFWFPCYSFTFFLKEKLEQSLAQWEAQCRTMSVRSLLCKSCFVLQLWLVWSPRSWMHIEKKHSPFYLHQNCSHLIYECLALLRYSIFPRVEESTNRLVTLAANFFLSVIANLVNNYIPIISWINGKNCTLRVVWFTSLCAFNVIQK